MPAHPKHLSTMTLTFIPVLENQQASSSDPVPSLMMIHSTFWSLWCSNGYFHINLLRPWPLTPDLENLYGLSFIWAKFDEDTCTSNGVICTWYSQGYFHKCSLWPWPLTLTLKIKRDHPIITNTWIKFDEDILNSVAWMLFTRLFSCMSIGTLTFHPWPWKSIGIILSSWTILVPHLVIFPGISCVATAKAKHDRWTDRRQMKWSLCGTLLPWSHKNWQHQVGTNRGLMSLSGRDPSGANVTTTFTFGVVTRVSEDCPGIIDKRRRHHYPFERQQQRITANSPTCQV